MGALSSSFYRLLHRSCNKERYYRSFIPSPSAFATPSANHKHLSFFLALPWCISVLYFSYSVFCTIYLFVFVLLLWKWIFPMWEEWSFRLFCLKWNLPRLTIFRNLAHPSSLNTLNSHWLSLSLSHSDKLSVYVLVCFQENHVPMLHLTCISVDASPHFEPWSKSQKFIWMQKLYYARKSNIRGCIFTRNNAR